MNNYLPIESRYPESAILSTYLFLVPVDISDNNYHDLLFSPLSGTLDFLNDKAARHIMGLMTGDKKVNMRSKIDKKLWDRGYLFENLETQKQQSYMLYNELLKFHLELQRHQIAIIPTYTCNLDCIYCWQDRCNLPTIVMDSDTIDLAFQAVDQLVEGVDTNLIDICLFGGEPLQFKANNIEIIKSISDKCKSRNFELKAITNGVNLRECIPLFNGNLSIVQVTLDGPAAMHESRRRGERGSFWKIIEGIDHAIDHEITVNIRVNVSSENLTSIPELAQFIKDRWGINGPRLYLSPVKGCDTDLLCNELKTLHELLNISNLNGLPKNINFSGYRAFRYISHLIGHDQAPLHKFFSCEAQLNFWALDPLGDIYVCFDACGNRKLSVGQFTPKLKINGSRLKRWRSQSSLTIEKCIVCPAAPLCSGGCAYIKESIDKHLCERLKDTIPIALKHYAKSIYNLGLMGSETVGFIVS